MYFYLNSDYPCCVLGIHGWVGFVWGGEWQRGGGVFLKPSANATSLASQLIDMVMCVLSAWLSLYLLLGVSMAAEWELSLF